VKHPCSNTLWCSTLTTRYETYIVLYNTGSNPWVSKVVPSWLRDFSLLRSRIDSTLDLFIYGVVKVVH